MSNDLFLSLECNYTLSDVTFKQKTIFLQVALPMLVFSNKTVTEARNNPASSPPIIVWIG